VESGLAVVSTTLFLLTLVWHDWLETLGLDPDHGDGTAEWLLVGVFSCVAILNAVLARTTWRRALAPG
jgi:hypothetical protein